MTKMVANNEPLTNDSSSSKIAELLVLSICFTFAILFLSYLFRQRISIFRMSNSMLWKSIFYSHIIYGWITSIPNFFHI